MKIDKEIIDEVLSNYSEVVDMGTRAKILREIEQEAQERKPEREKQPKKHFMIVALTDDEKISEVPMYVVQLPEDQDHTEIPFIIEKGTAEFNTTPKGRKLPVTTVADAMGDVKRKCFTERGLSVKTKEPTIIVTMKNEIEFDQEDE